VRRSASIAPLLHELHTFGQERGPDSGAMCARVTPPVGEHGTVGPLVLDANLRNTWQRLQNKNSLRAYEVRTCYRTMAFDGYQSAHPDPCRGLDRDYAPSQVNARSRRG
ncbi:MAG: hypothetical protein ACXVJO_15505, partial [Thermoanaerobaculia bacterium]